MLKRAQDHEQKMKLLTILQEDPEMKYFLGVASGAAVGAFGWILELAGFEAMIGQGQTSEEDSNSPYSWLFKLPVPGTGVTAEQAGGAWQTVAKIGSPAYLVGDWLKDHEFGIGDVFKLGGGGFAAFCAMILVFKSMNPEGGGGGGGGILSMLTGGVV